MRVGKSRGFTMIEVMVSVGILTMVGAMLYSTIVVTFTAQKAAQEVHAVHHAGWVAMNKMVRDITNAFISRHVSVLEKNRETLFLGKDDKITFTYLGHYRWYPETPESDQGVVTYFVKNKKLIRREKTIIDDRPEKGGEEDVLAERVKKLEFEYFDPIAEDWTDDWKAELESTDPIFLDKAEEKAHNLGKKLAGLDPEDEFVLPTRVRIRLVLLDEEDKEYPFESEAHIPLRNAFNW